jgi:short-subunit dehydrogenase
MNGKLFGKKCLVTGASRGIGKSIVKRLLESGAKVVASASNNEGLIALEAEFSNFSQNLITISADLSSTSDVDMLCRSVTTAVGNIDILINNAGILHLEDLHNCSEDLLRKSFEVNFFSAFALSRYFSESMIKNSSGIIINICSSSSYMVVAPQHSIYASTKHALLGLTRALDEELRPHNIRVGSVSPAGVSTDMMSGRGDLDHSTFMSADDVASSVMVLVESDGPGIIYEMRMWRMNR